MNSRKTFSYLLVFALFFLLVFLFPHPVQAWLQTDEVGVFYSYGFLAGIWHGLIAPFALIAQLFNNDIVLYASVNNGFWYNVGFLLGISAVIGGGARST